MEEEAVIIAVEPKIIGLDNFDCELGHTSTICNYEKKLYEVNQPITSRSEYVAIRHVESMHITLLFKIEQIISIFEKGKSLC